MLQYIDIRDQRLMRRVNHWRAPRWVRVWMLYATRGGDGWLWYAMAVCLAVSEHWAALAAMSISAALSITLFLRLKKLTGRKRPCAIEPHCWATLLPPDQFSFPSGHSMTAFAVVTPVSMFYPDLTAGLVFCAISIAISRVLLGMHFLSDVLAGSLLGGVLGYLVYNFFV